jgi:hypothetical protein
MYCKMDMSGKMTLDLTAEKHSAEPGGGEQHVVGNSCGVTENTMSAWQQLRDGPPGKAPVHAGAASSLICQPGPRIKAG